MFKTTPGLTRLTICKYCHANIKICWIFENFESQYECKSGKFRQYLNTELGICKKYDKEKIKPTAV